MNEKTYYLYGAIGGDMIGSPYEFNNLKSKDFPLFNEKSRLTDDSVMTVASAETIITQGDYATNCHKLGNQYFHCVYGGRFRRWLQGATPGAPYNSWGNGSAMRDSPVGFAFNSKEEVFAEAKRAAECTHDHPEGITGDQAATYAVFLARTGRTKEEIKKEIEREFEYELSQTLNDIRPTYSFDVSCVGTLPVAVIAFLESSDYEDAIHNAVSVGGDSEGNH